MERRKFMIGMGSLAAGGSAAIGSGAFTSVQADRAMDVRVADDSSAFLQLTAPDDELENGEYALGPNEQGSQLTIELDSGAETEAGKGVNLDAITRLDEVFKVANLGSQEVDLFIGDGDLSEEQRKRIRFYTTEQGGRQTLENGQPDGSADGVKNIALPLGAGEAKTVGIEIDTRDDAYSGASAVEQPKQLVSGGEIVVYTQA